MGKIAVEEKTTTTQKEKNKQAIQNINKSGTVSGKSSGVSNVSKVVNTNINTSNLSGANQKQNGSPKVSNTGSNPTGVNTKSYNLAGSNNIKASTGTSNTGAKTYNNAYTTNSTGSKVSVTTVADNQKKYQSDLNKMADSSVKKAQSIFQRAGDFYNDVKKDVDAKLAEDRKTPQKYTVSRMIEDKINETNQKNMAFDEDQRNQYVNSIREEDIAKMMDENGNLIDFQPVVKQLETQLAGYDQLLASEDLDEKQRLTVENERRKTAAELEEKRDLFNKSRAWTEKYQLDYYEGQGDLDAANSLREQFSHKDDNMLQRFGNAAAHLITETANEIPTAIDQIKLSGQTNVANDYITELEALHDSGEISDDQYAEGLKYWGQALQDYKDDYFSSFSQQFQSEINQLSANTHYGASEIEDFMLQAGESTAQFVLHYAIGKATSSFVFGENAVMQAGTDLAIEQYGAEAIKSIGKEQLMNLGSRVLGGEIATTTMSLASSTSKFNQLLQEGYDVETAMQNAIFTGLVSYAVEKVGMDRFIDMLGTNISVSILGEVLKKNVSSAISEGAEELVEGLIDPVVDFYTLGKDVEVNGSELWMAFLLGGTSGLAMSMAADVGSIYNSYKLNQALMNNQGVRQALVANTGKLLVGTRAQYNMLKNEVNKLDEYKSSMTPDQLSVAEELSNLGKQALSEYEAKSTTLGVEFPEDTVTTTTQQENDQTLVQTLESDFNQDVKMNEDINQLQEKIRNDIADLAAADVAAIESIQQSLYEHGYDIDANLFSQLSEAERNNALVAADFSKITGINAKVTDYNGIRDALINNGFNGTQAELNDLVNGSSGFVNKNGEIFINALKRPVLYTLTHELTHGTESSKYYEPLKKIVQESTDWETNYKDRTKAYKWAKKTMSEEEFKDYVEKETVARSVEKLLGDEKFINDLVKYNYSLASRIWQDLNAMGSNDETDKIRNAFEKAFRDNYEQNMEKLSFGGENALDNMLKSDDPLIREKGEKLNAKLFEAKEMLAQGATQKQIWEKTGWIQKADGKWRFEFFDGSEEALINLYKMFEGDYVMSSGAFTLDYIIPEDSVLFEMYPELKGMIVAYSSENKTDENGAESKGGYNPEKKNIELNIRDFVKTNGNYIESFQDTGNKLAENLFHEIQHAIQDIEGFAPGSNLEKAKTEIQEPLIKEFKRILKMSEADYNKYKHLYDSIISVYTNPNIDNGVANQYINEAVKMYGKDAFDVYHDIRNNLLFDEIYTAYKNSPGEIEARDSAARTVANFMLSRTEEGSKEYNDAKRLLSNIPLIGNEKTSVSPYSTGMAGNNLSIADRLKNVKFSYDPVKMDADYMKAVDSGDMETAQQMVNERARQYAEETGQKLYEGFHGTNAVFNEFLEEKLGSKNFLAESAKLGYFMARSKETAESYTGLNSADIFRINFDKNMEEKRQQLRNKYGLDELEEADTNARKQFVEESLDKVFADHLYGKTTSRIGEVFPEWTQEQIDSFTEEMRKNVLYEIMDDGQSRANHFYDEYNNTSEIHKKFQEANTKALEEYDQIALDYLGYTPNVKHLFAFMKDPLVHDFKNEGRDVDFSVLMKEAHKDENDGVVFENVQDGGDFDTIYAVFKPNQFKSADPVTYDDDGNVIPLSKRFNPNTNDLRFDYDNPDDLNISEKELTKNKLYGKVTDQPKNKGKNINRENGILSPKFITELDSTIDRTTRQEEVDDAERVAGKIAQQLDNGADPEEILKKIKKDPLNNGIIRALTIGQVLADRGLTNEMYDLAQWARDTDRLAGQLIESTKYLHQLDNSMTRSIYLAKVQQNMVDEYKAQYGKKAKLDIEKTIEEIFSSSAEKIINAKTTREFQKALGKLTREVRNRMPKSLWDRIAQFRILAMLSGAKTPIGNTESNVAAIGLYKLNNVNQAVLESALKNAKLNNIDEVKDYGIKTSDKNAKLLLNREQTKINKRFANEVWKQYDTGIKTKYGTEVEKVPDIIKKNLKTKNENLKSPLGKAVDTAFDIATSIQSTLLDDSPFQKFAFVNKFNELAQAREMDLRTIDKNSKEYNKLVDDAYDYSQEVVSHDVTAISKTLANISKHSSTNVRVNEDSVLGGLDKAIKFVKEKANKGEPAYKLLDNALMRFREWGIPFFNTNASLLKKAVQFSPLEWGQVINDYGKVKKGNMSTVEMVEHMAKAVTGTELYLLGAIFSRLGWLKWDRDDEDYSGRLAIRIPGTKYGYTIDFLDPVSTIFAKGVIADQQLMENGVSFKTLQEVIKDRSVLFLSDEMDMFSTMMDFFQTFKNVTKGENEYGEYTLGDGATDTAYSILNTYIPAIIRDISRVADPAKKSVYDDDNWKYLYNRLLNSTPFRGKLTDKKDATGRTIDYTQPYTSNDFVNRLITQMVSKGKLVDMEGSTVTSKSGESNLGDKADEFSQMANDFQYSDENGDGYSDQHWIRDSLPANIYPGGEQVELTGEARDEYGKTWSDIWTTGAKTLSDNKVYKGLSYENQADVVYELQTFSRECVEADYCKANNIEMTPAQKRAYSIREFCTKNGKLDGELLSLIALGTAKENKLANGGQQYVLAEKDKDGKTVRNSRQLYMRQLYEEAGVYDDVLKAIEKYGLTYADFGLSKTVVNKKEDKADYQDIYNKTMSKSNGSKTSGRKAKKGSSKKASSKKISGGSLKGGGSVNKLTQAKLSPAKNTNLNFFKAYQSTFNQKRGSSKVSESGSSSQVCPNCGARVSANASRCPNCGAKL